jgi:beta-lactamase regulating signal transducer with metallopeptidase domain
MWVSSCEVIAPLFSEQTITKGTNITQSVGSASNLQGGNVNINAQDITAVKFEAMLVVVALVLALILLENKPLALDFICVALESWTAQQQLSLNSAKDINIKAGYDGSLNESQ